ncbi:MAG: BACON domain-containing protein [Bacteroidaceae bacterium]|nr:BACON domain-containing protein [Bacteroidaceae bacterium]
MAKYILKITLSLAVALLAAACTDDEGKVVGFSVNNDESVITFDAAGGKKVVLVETDESWVATTMEPWITISPANGLGSVACEIIVDSSLTNEVRPGAIRFTPGISPAKTLKVEQFGFDKMILPKDSVLTIESSEKLDKRYFEAEISSNVQFKVECDFMGNDEWLTPAAPEFELDRGARPRTIKLRFDWKMNTDTLERVAEIKFVPKSAGDVLKKEAILTVRQKAAVKIEDNRAGDSIALVVINERLNCWSDAWDTSENMQYWSGVKLWEKTDTALPCPEAVGRVRSVEYFLIDTKESLPSEFKYLKYLESLSVSSNINTMLLDIELGTEICDLEYLKNIRLFSYGLVSLPAEFVKLGNSLETLDLSANNFTAIPEILTQENFPKLKSLNFIGSRRYTTSDLRKADSYKDRGGVGLHFNTDTDNTLRNLLLWENLEELSLSNCYIEGTIPDFKVGEDGVVTYEQKDVDAWGGDTIQYVADNKIPKILPNCTMLRLNLNFFTGKLPDWLRYHPHLLEWMPDLLIFHQQEKGYNSEGKVVGFDNAPSTFDYYYEAFPALREKFEFKDEITNE